MKTVKILVSVIVFALFFLGCSTTIQPTGASGSESPDVENITLENVDKAVYLRRIYEKDGKNFLEFDDVGSDDSKLTSLPIAEDVKVFLPNYYPEALFYKLQQDLKDPNNKNIKDVLYYLTIDEGEVQAIKRPYRKN